MDGQAYFNDFFLQNIINNIQPSGSYYRIPSPKLSREHIGMMDIDLPDVYTNGIGYNYTSFRIVDYPFSIINLAQEFNDLDQGKTYKYKVPAELDFSSAQGIDRPLSNEYLTVDSSSKRIYILSFVHGNWFAQVFSMRTWEMEHYIDLHKLIPKIQGNTYFLQIIPNKGLIYAADESGLVRGYPLSILFSK